MALSARWQPYSRLFLAADAADWVLGEEMRQLGRIARRVGISVASTEHALGVSAQSVFYASQFVLLDPAHFGRNRVGLAYFHGRRYWEEEPSFAACYSRLRAERDHISRVQVSNQAMREFILGSGLPPDRVHVIPISVDPWLFRPATPESRAAVRARLGLPSTAVVIGSFQKDGVGWGEGRHPKLIKGPDVFISAVRRLRAQVPELVVLLSGPARGYVRGRLEAAGIPYRYIYVPRYADVVPLYHAIDLYLVTSREEGGPKALLESMACGVPLITTRVGQALDLVRHGENAWIVDVDDVEEIVHWSMHALAGPKPEVIAAGRATAEENSYDRQIPLWAALFKGFVDAA